MSGFRIAVTRQGFWNGDKYKTYGCVYGFLFRFFASSHKCAIPLQTNADASGVPDLKIREIELIKLTGLLN